MFCTVVVNVTFEVADEAEAQRLIRAARLRAVKVGTHEALDAVEEIVSVRDALQYLMTDAAIDLPINPVGVSICADVSPVNLNESVGA